MTEGVRDSQDERKIVQTLKRCHENLGHPSQARFIAMLKNLRATDRVLKLAKGLSCPVCESTRRERSHRVSRHERAEQLNQQLYMDTFEVELPWRKLKVDLAPELCRGWQRAASWIIDDRCAAQLRESLDPASCALLESQAGPYASRVLTALPTAPEEVRLDSAAFRLTLLWRLRLALPLDTARCRCRRPLDVLGDHRAACPRSGVLRPRGIPFERAAARVCREAGATGATIVSLRDLMVHQDERRIEVLQTACLFGAAPSWQSTPPWCQP